MEPFCESFGCSEAIGMDMACVVVAVCADYDPMYGSEVWVCADTIAPKMITVLTRYRPNVLELI